jgi:hypothetical protein
MRLLPIVILVGGHLVESLAAKEQFVFRHGWQQDFIRFAPPSTSLASRGPPQEGSGQIPLKISNNCEATIWPGIATQSGTGPGTGGFELPSRSTTDLWVSPDWQGRVWGRTNCTVNGDSCACETGDCFNKLDCEFSVSEALMKPPGFCQLLLIQDQGATPATLAEFNLAGGFNGMQTFYDISLVDGYNIPMAITYIPAKNTTFIPPNLTNVACIATSGWLHAQNQTGTYYSNATYPIPLESSETNNSIRNWCPWALLVFPPMKPRDDVYHYPDDALERPEFSPCHSACAASGRDQDCCIGRYHDPKVCKPSSYSKAVKAICPDAYSFAFDDQQSTFIVPKGGGWEVIMCPEGRSTNILRQLGNEMFELASAGSLSQMTVSKLRNATYINSDKSAATRLQLPPLGIPLATTLVSWLLN